MKPPKRMIGIMQRGAMAVAVPASQNAHPSSIPIELEEVTRRTRVKANLRNFTKSGPNPTLQYTRKAKSKGKSH